LPHPVDERLHRSTHGLQLLSRSVGLRYVDAGEVVFGLAIGATGTDRWIICSSVVIAVPSLERTSYARRRIHI